MADNESELLIEWYKPDKKKLAQIRELYNYLTVEMCYKEYNIKHHTKKSRSMLPVFKMPPDFQETIRYNLTENNKKDNNLFVEADEEEGRIKICYAQINDEIIGFEMLQLYRNERNVDSIEIIAMYIKKQHRDGFVSYKLNEAVERYCNDNKKRHIYIETTDPRNARLYSMKEGGNYTLYNKDSNGIFYLEKDLTDKNGNNIDEKSERQR